MAKSCVRRSALLAAACLLFLLALPRTASAARGGGVPMPRPAAAVRYNAGSNSPVIGWLELGTELTVLGEAGGYYRVDCYDMTGYLLQTLVTRENEKYYVNFQEGARDTTRFYSRPIGEVLPVKRVAYAEATALTGIPYRLGGVTTGGFDCSGLTQYVMARTGYDIARTCLAQMGQGIIIPKEALQCGDLVFFENTTAQWSITSHVGIYIGGGRLLHAGVRGVAIVELDSEYYREHYLCARRYILTDPLTLGKIPSALGWGLLRSAELQVQPAVSALAISVQ